VNNIIIILVIAVVIAGFAVGVVLYGVIVVI